MKKPKAIPVLFWDLTELCLHLQKNHPDENLSHSDTIINELDLLGIMGPFLKGDYACIDPQEALDNMDGFDDDSKAVKRSLELLLVDFDHCLDDQGLLWCKV